MAHSSFSHLFISTLFITTLLAFSLTHVHAGADHRGLSWLPAAKPNCHGSIAECMANDEFQMDSESNRRILATTNYISYGALQRNTVPCSRRGASYYNCQPGAEANPYSRGCSAITRCRS